MARKKKTMTYQKRKVHFNYVSDVDTEVQIDEAQFDVYRDPKSKRYSTPKLPYAEYENLDDLVKAVIDKHPDYRGSTS